MNLEERHWCGNRCSEHGIRFNQVGAMVTEEGGEAHTIILCRLWYNENQVRQGKQPLKVAGWKIVELEAHRGRLWKMFRCEQFMRGMWEYFKKEYKVGGSRSPPGKEVLEQVKGYPDADCDACMMRRAYHARGIRKLGRLQRGILEKKRQVQRMDLC